MWLYIWMSVSTAKQHTWVDGRFKSFMKTVATATEVMSEKYELFIYLPSDVVLFWMLVSTFMQHQWVDGRLSRLWKLWQQQPKSMSEKWELIYLPSDVALHWMFVSTTKQHKWVDGLFNKSFMKFVATAIKFHVRKKRIHLFA